MEPNDQSPLNPTPPVIARLPQRGPKPAVRVILCLLVGLAPTPIALATVASGASKTLDDSTVVVLLLVVDVVLSFAGAFGIVSSLASKSLLRVLLTIALGLTFGVLNAVVSFFTGCLLLVGK
ncbi:MAG: hypothetical protein H7X97_01440 [Opitutaceae bacterium]|nr:hypothetical protein [Verrucomicrobiales bacterium]